MRIHSTHKRLVGSIHGEPFAVEFDAEGYADVADAVGLHLIANRAASQAQLVPQDEEVPAEKRRTRRQTVQTPKEEVDA